MVGFQNRFFSFQPHVHILRRYRHSRLSEGAVQSQAVVFSAQALVCLSAKSWRFVSFGRSFNFQLLWKSPSLIPTEKRQVASLNQKIFENLKSPFTCSHWEEQNYRVFLKIFLFCKRPLHSFGQRVPKCTPISGLFLKNFLRKIYPSLIWNYKAKWHPISQKKWENIFSVAGALFCSPKKVPSLIPTGKRQIPTLFQKIFCCLQKSPHLFPLGEGGE